MWAERIDLEMFETSKVDIHQPFQNSNSQSDKWMMLKLLRPRVVTILGVSEEAAEMADATVWRYIYQQHEVVQCWGRWKQDANSLSDYNYILGMGSPEDQFWTYSYSNLTVNFIERQRWTDTPANQFDFVILMTLFGALMGPRGFNPIATGGPPSPGRRLGPDIGVIGSGRAYQGSGNFIQRGPVTWENAPSFS
jgi:hypothetical protein